MANFPALIVDKNPPSNHSHAKACTQFSECENHVHALTFGWNDNFGAM